MVQTPVHVSLLQKLLHYFNLAANVGMIVPEPHVRAISTLIDALTDDLIASPVLGAVTTGQTNQPEGFAAPIAPTAGFAVPMPIEKPATPNVESAQPAVTHETVGIPPTS